MERTVLFLDIDGVFHPADACGPMPDGTVFGENLFRWVQSLLDLLDDMPQVDVVLHSSWRHCYTSLPGLLADLPPRLAARVIGVTPVEIADRQTSIEAYVKRHRVKRFVAVDDAKFHFDEGLAWLLLCGPDGLSNRNTVQALRDALDRA